jgi:DNA-binding MarR family transcriptional regulator
LSEQVAASEKTKPAIPSQSESPEDLAIQLRSSTTKFVRRMRMERPPHGLTMTQISTLFTLGNAGSLTPRQLADAERVQPPAITRTLAVLEERGFVERAPHPTDGRQVLLTPTAAGRELLDEDRRAREAWLAARLDELGPREREALRTASAILGELAAR